MELKIIVFMVFFSVFSNILIANSGVIDDVEYADNNAYIEEVTNGMGSITGFVLGSLITIADFILSFLGFSLIAYLSILPLWLNTILITFNSLTILAVLFYVINALWIG